MFFSLATNASRPLQTWKNAHKESTEKMLNNKKTQKDWRPCLAATAEAPQDKCQTFPTQHSTADQGRVIGDRLHSY